MLLRPVEGEVDFFDARVRIVCERGFTCVKGSGCFEEALLGLGGFVGIDCCLRGDFWAMIVLGVIFLEPVRVREVFA